MKRVYVRSLPCGVKSGNLSRRRVSCCPSRRHVRIFCAIATAPSPLTYHSAFVWKDDFNDRFIREREIGHGSYGKVWLALDKETNEQVAVKEMPKTRGKLTAQGTFAKIDREITVMAELKSCPATVQLKECHALPGSYRIVMEYCSGFDLRQQIKQHGPASEAVVACVAHEILLILKKCHAKRIVHGDVKTANFILRSADVNPFASDETEELSTGWLKAIDFGCSQFALDGKRIASRVGTPVFMAPEVFDRDYLFESDLWSLGIVLYQLISGRFPFWNSSTEAVRLSVEDVMEAVCCCEPDFTQAPFDTVSPECLDLLRSLLDKDYTKRTTAGEAIEHPFIQKHKPKQSSCEMSTNNILPTASGSLNTVLTEA